MMKLFTYLMRLQMVQKYLPLSKCFQKISTEFVPHPTHLFQLNIAVPLLGLARKELVIGRHYCTQHSPQTILYDKHYQLRTVSWDLLYFIHWWSLRWYFQCTWINPNKNWLCSIQSHWVAKERVGFQHCTISAIDMRTKKKSQFFDLFSCCSLLAARLSSTPFLLLFNHNFTIHIH